ncbi:30S ribosomal protein S11 [Candidatus Nesciobacter abundans]|uniref:Small ribosomal subunit protein uS11 n=1 Tax=Candidatus Nesciobacter abundans TaxID=2601668 RepID=A0A5C0UH90_9PROT|nr:30S ribosomal protein S11 [Candidatus Nesciobacter abundans]QEK38923.1 30S ribosomal protein S11 [Candidatus Nesciobacter abundans]
MSKKKRVGVKKKSVHKSGKVYIKATSNNTIMTLVSNETKQVIAWCSPGVVNIKGSRKSTPYAAQTAANKLSEKMHEFGMVEVDIVLVGLGSGRDSAMKAIQGNGFRINSVEDRTSFPHNGCKLPRRPRV